MQGFNTANNSRWRAVGLAAILVALPVTATLAAPRSEFATNTFVTKTTRLWTEPSKYGEPIAALDPGLELRVMKYTTTSSWALVRTPSGREGWVPVRFTSLTGRRDRPLIAADGAGEKLDGTKKERGPASDNSAPLDGNAHWQLSYSLGYQNLVSRDALSGFGLGIAAESHGANRAWTLGFGFDFSYFQQTIRGTGASEVHTGVRRLFPHALGKVTLGPLDLLAGLGVDVDNTRFTSRDVNGDPVDSTVDGATGGGDTNFALGVKIRPAFRFQTKPDSSFGIFLLYYATIDLSSGAGRFVGTSSGGTPVGRVANTFGGGLMYSHSL